MNYEDCQTSSRSSKLPTPRIQSPASWREVPGRSASRRAAREEFLAEIQHSADTDAGADTDKQADDVTFGHKMAPSVEPYWDIDPYDFADEDLASLLRGDGKKKVDLMASMHMLKLKRLAANLGKTAWNDISPSTASLSFFFNLKVFIKE